MKNDPPSRLVATLQEKGSFSPRTLAAIKRVPRDIFCHPSDISKAWHDSVLPLAEGSTLSQPFVVATMLEALNLKGGERILDVGSGSGWTTALLCELGGIVHAIERLPKLYEESTQRLRDLGYSNAHCHLGNGVHGLPDHAPFDAILVSAAFPYTPPDLLDQLALDGRLVAPIGGGKSQTLRVLTAKPERIQAEQDLMTVRFVPLIP